MELAIIIKALLNFSQITFPLSIPTKVFFKFHSSNQIIIFEFIEIIDIINQLMRALGMLSEAPDEITLQFFKKFTFAAKPFQIIFESGIINGNFSRILEAKFSNTDTQNWIKKKY